MFVYQSLGTRATPAYNTPFSQHRNAFAHSAVYEEFRPQDARAIDQNGFVDRQPDQPPRLLGTIEASVVGDIGQRALRHWLNQAGRADTDDEREAALEIARNIARLAGLKIDLPGRRAV